MASMLDIGLLDYFVPVFVFLLIFVALYALLEKTGFFGKTKGLNAMIAFAIAFLFILTPDLMGVVKIMTPWFTVLFVFVFMIILMFMFVGIKEESVMKAFSERGMVWIVVIISLIVFIYALTQVYGSQIQTIYAGEEVADDNSITGQIGKIIFHPRILGVLLLLMVAAQAIRMIAGKFE
ncbi:MAG: hypothetical protein KKA65_00870 [Nanoarchaeota archaeon]|nr:hypothetical protein [Nanoarchaeota archaeon]MBU4242247.1 hypothetical protein [Nanoarchaeota archaeon]MBU4352274.1 hypothetical protein [Nanoarchaeota archaeon]MBU4456030.1 hypothetical protein [Nanoarchaeota archaeon]MCG2719540.1 hypothetical protein [Nanoarchaeota archaeon]